MQRLFCSFEKNGCPTLEEIQTIFGTVWQRPPPSPPSTVKPPKKATIRVGIRSLALVASFKKSYRSESLSLLFTKRVTGAHCSCRSLSTVKSDKSKLLPQVFTKEQKS